MRRGNRGLFHTSLEVFLVVSMDYKRETALKILKSVLQLKLFSVYHNYAKYYLICGLIIIVRK